MHSAETTNTLQNDTIVTASKKDQKNLAYVPKTLTAIAL